MSSTICPRSCRNASERRPSPWHRSAHRKPTPGPVDGSARACRNAPWRWASRSGRRQGFSGKSGWAPNPLLIILTGSSCASSINRPSRCTQVSSRRVAVPPAVVLSPRATATLKGVLRKSRLSRNVEESSIGEIGWKVPAFSPCHHWSCQRPARASGPSQRTNQRTAQRTWLF